MLSLADQQLVARDGALPGLALLLDPEALRHRIHTAFPNLNITRLTPSYLRYKQGTSCLAGFSLESTEDAPRWMTANARRRDAYDKIDKAKADCARHVLNDDAIIFSFFPHDRRLKALEPQRAARMLKALAQDGASLKPMRYRPERRFVARLERDGQASGLLKIYGQADYAKCLARTKALAASDLLAASERHSALLTRWVDGDAVNDADAVGAALAQLHQSRDPGLRQHTPAEQALRLVQIASDLGSLMPDQQRRARSIARSLTQALMASAYAPCPIHGDFHLEQMIAARDGVRLIDFDEAARGDPAWDLGNLVGHLLSDGMPGAEPFGETMLGAYRRSGGTVSEAAMQLHIAQSLYRLSTRPFRRRDPDWPTAIGQMLDAVEARLPAEISTSAQNPVPQDPSMPLLDRALDPVVAQAAIGGTWTIASARLIRHKPGRRCLIAYGTEGPHLIAKMRTKGADRRAFLLQHHLFANGFGLDARDGICVPEPLALVPDLALWVQHHAEGIAADQAIDAGALPPERAAEALAKLHRVSAPTAKRHSVQDEMAILNERLTGLAERRRALAPRVMKLLANAERQAGFVRPIRPRGIHRDFYFDHLLVDGDRLTLVDLDLFCSGDPAIDVGNFTAHLIEQDIRLHRDPDRRAAWRHQFVLAYLRLVADVSPTQVALYEALSLARLVEISDRMDERRPHLSALLDQAEHQLAHPRPARSLVYEI